MCEFLGVEKHTNSMLILLLSITCYCIVNYTVQEQKFNKSVFELHVWLAYESVLLVKAIILKLRCLWPIKYKFKYCSFSYNVPNKWGK